MVRFWSMIGLCVLSFACKKEHGKKAEPSASAYPGDRSKPVEVARSTADESVRPSKTDDLSGMSDLSLGCRLAVDCVQALPDPGPPLGFRSQLTSLFVKLGAVHRGRDVVITQGQDPTLIAKFAYGIGIDKDVKGEQVDIYMQRGCKDGWQMLGSVQTSPEPKADEIKQVDGVDDKGGFVMVKLSSLGLKDLAEGRHRFVFFLRANNEHTEAFVEVLPKSHAMVLSDIDGTLTAFEEAAATEVLFKSHPESHVGAADVLRSFYHRGYTLFYLTARPAFLMERTRLWLNARGFPPGIIHTTNLVQGAVGEAAAQFKADELALLKKSTGIIPTYAFGNKASDVKAFADGGIPRDKSWFYKIKDDTTGSQALEDYRALIPEAQAAPSFCP
jgi:hypothetical protein